MRTFRMILFFSIVFSFVAFAQEADVKDSAKAAEATQKEAAEEVPPPVSKPEVEPEPAPDPEPVPEVPAPAAPTPPVETVPTPPAVETPPTPKPPVSVPPPPPAKPDAPATPPKKLEVPVEPTPAAALPKPEEKKAPPPPAPTEPAPPAEKKASPEPAPAPAVSAKTPAPTPPATDIKKEPKKVEKDVPTARAAVPSELKGIDTLDIDEPGGNWLVKRMWWEKAEEKINKIEEEVDKIMKSRMAFFEKRDKADSELFDPFYLEAGLDQGQLEEITTHLIGEMKRMRKERDRLTREEREFSQKLQDEKQVLKQAKADVEAIRKLDDSLDDFVTKLVEQINVASRYRKEARELFKEIGKILDHNKARELFHKVEALWQSVKGVGKYISDSFTQSFEQILTNARAQTGRIKTAMDKLEQKGIGFKKQLEILKDKADTQEEKERRREELKKKMEDSSVDLGQEEGPGMMSRIMSTVASPFVAAWEWMSSFWKTQEQPEEVLETEEVIIEQVPEKKAPEQKEVPKQPEKSVPPKAKAPEKAPAVPAAA